MGPPRSQRGVEGREPWAIRGGQAKQDHCWGPGSAAHGVPKAPPSWLVSPRTQLASLKSTQIKYRQRDSSQCSEEQG